MQTTSAVVCLKTRTRPCDAARRRLERGERAPVFAADWMRALMLHYEVSAEVLQPHVPFELDLREGRAYVSLVAFTQERLRPALGGIAGRVFEFFSAPLAAHGFLNVRTYVRVNGEPGICFLAEYIPNALAVLVGPRLYGLPYRLGKLDYRTDEERGRFEGHVSVGRAADRAGLRFDAQWRRSDGFDPAPQESLTEFLMERYSAYTQQGRARRRFRIWHEPWPQMSAEVCVEGCGMEKLAGKWWPQARYIGANYSPGVRGVWIGRPEQLTDAHPTS
ncbi:MAG: DUF2071 domain-containing protein [Planctomycetes bacterium]|nr:DUF2071 domain-containing protein [Planctomycetota bacterium]